MRLSRFLPPFASDYSGAASVLAGCDAQLVFVDPGCCTYGFLEAEGACWDDAELPVASAQLRVVDTALGADDALARQVGAALGRAPARLVALLGTPVPALVGMDLSGLARQVQNATGVPAVGIETDGFSCYDVGIRKAYEAALSALDEAKAVRGGGRQARGGARRARDDARPRAALVGFNPFDFGSREAVRATRRFVEDGGWEAALPFGAERAQTSDLARCEVTLVGSESGLALARSLQARYGTPLLCWSPECLERDMGKLAALAARGDPFALLEASAQGSSGARVLVVAEQVFAHALARTLAKRAPGVAVTVASFFSDRDAARQLGTVELGSEEDLAALLRRGAYDVLVADPLLFRLPEARGALAVPCPHRAISGRLYDRWEGAGAWDDVVAQALAACASLA